MCKCGQQHLDWEVLELEGVAGLVDKAAHKISTVNPSIEYRADDLRQEAMIMLASRGGQVREQLGEGLEHYVLKELEHDLANLVETPRRRESKNISYEERVAVLEG